MHIEFKKYPIDLILCLIYSIAIIPISLLNMEGMLRIAFGLPFVLFIPGYILIFFLFPMEKGTVTIGVVERFALSLGLSMALIALIGIGLFYSSLGLRLEYMLFSIFFFIIGVGSLAVYRWFKIPPDKRFIISLSISYPTSKSKFDSILIVTIIICLILTTITIFVITAFPRDGETSTEFYLLGPQRKTTTYPENLLIGENRSVIIGIINHEKKIINYTVEVWLVNYTILFNKSTNENEIIYNEMWFMDKVSQKLESHPRNKEQIWESQWEYNYTFNIQKKGNYTLTFLLYTTPTQEYDLSVNYKPAANLIYERAYQSAYLWVSIN